MRERRLQIKRFGSLVEGNVDTNFMRSGVLIFWTEYEYRDGVDSGRSLIGERIGIRVEEDSREIHGVELCLDGFSKFVCISVAK